MLSGQNRRAGSWVLFTKPRSLYSPLLAHKDICEERETHKWTEKRMRGQLGCSVSGRCFHASADAGVLLIRSKSRGTNSSHLSWKTLTVSLPHTSGPTVQVGPTMLILRLQHLSSQMICIFFLSYMPFRSKCCVRGSPVQWCLFRLFHFLWACLKVESTCQHGVQWVQMMMQRSTLALMKWRNVGFTVFSSGDKKIWIKFAAVPQCTSIKEWL